MRVAVYTLTWDRLDYTKHCFRTLEENAGYPYDHFVVDNGSTDGTVEWLHQGRFRQVIFNASNLGLSLASNQMLEAISGYDLIVKFDNDCEVVSSGILAAIVQVFQDPSTSSCVLSPRVEGVNQQPERGWYSDIAGRRIGWTSIVGGLFQAVRAELYQQYRYPVELSKYRGQSWHFCRWVRERGGQVGYLEDLLVKHYEGTDNQMLRYPGYFARKDAAL